MVECFEFLFVCLRNCLICLDFRFFDYYFNLCCLGLNLMKLKRRLDLVFLVDNFKFNGVVLSFVNGGIRML